MPSFKPRSGIGTVLLAGVLAGTIAAFLSAQQGDWPRPVLGGRVVDTSRHPVAGATVRLIESPHPGLPRDLHSAFPLGPRTYRETTTDSAGRFRFAVRHGDRAALQAYRMSDRGTDHLMSLVSERVPAGEYVTITAWLTRVVHGVCRDLGTGRPLSKHPVHVLVPIGNGSDLDETLTLRLSTLTDADGRYRVRVPLGTWVRIRTTGPGCLHECIVHENLKNDFAVGIATPMAGTVLDSSGQPLGSALVHDTNDPRVRCRTDARGNFCLQPTGHRHQQKWVHVFAAGHAPGTFNLSGPGQQPNAFVVPTGNRIRVRLIDRGGTPVANSSVVLGGFFPAAALPGSHITSYELHTDANGILDVHVPHDCTYLSAFVQYQGRYVWFFSGAPKAGGDVGNITIAPVPELRGRVICGTRLPAARQRILLMRLPDDGSKPDLIASGSLRLPALGRWTDRGGRFAFPLLQPGTYEVAFRAEHHGAVVQQFRVPLGKDDGKLVRGGTLWFELPALRPIQGSVVDQTGAPVQGATVVGAPQGPHVTANQAAMYRFGLNPQGNVTASTDQKGRFLLFANDDDEIVIVSAYVPRKPHWSFSNAEQLNPKKPRALRLVMR